MSQQDEESVKKEQLSDADLSNVSGGWKDSTETTGGIKN
ncbi:MAG: bacteriocin [Syntrophomonas sp.]